jgi:deazaflavin-dependent oxidoreductase (nitroreductase family)
VNERFVLWASTNAFTTWVIRHVATRLDPWLFKASNGRFTSMGKPSMPMVTLMTAGAKTGKPRPVHLACIEHEGQRLVVASAMGQQRHPAWRYNLEAHPEIGVQAPGERYRARAELLDDREKDAVWPLIKETIPQMVVYEQRTDRNIGVFRLVPLTDS